MEGQIKNYQKAIQEKRTFSIGGAINLGMSITKKDFGTLLLSLIVSGIISMAAGFIPLVGSLSFFVTIPISLGLYYICYDIFKNGNSSMGRMFDLFKTRYLPSIGFGVLSAIVMIALFIPVIIYAFISIGSLIMDLIQGGGISDMKDPQQLIYFFTANAAKLILPFIVMGIYGLLISPFFVLSRFVFLFDEASPWDSIVAGFKLGANNYFNIIGFAIVVGLINILGALCLGIGLLFTIPLTFASSFGMYELCVGTDKDINFRPDSDKIVSSNFDL